MPNLGPVEIGLIVLLVVILFGVGRIGKIGGELGKSIREFRKGIQGDDDKSASAGNPSASEQKQ